MNNKNFEMIINVPNIPPEVFPEVIDRIQIAVKSILEEYGAKDIKYDRKN